MARGSLDAQHPLLRSALGVFAFVTLFSLPTRASDPWFSPGPDAVQLTPPAPESGVAHAYPTSKPLRLAVQAVATGTQYYCGDPSHGCSSAPSSPDHCVKLGSAQTTSPIAATLVSATCSDARCAATLGSDGASVEVSVSEALAATVDVTMREPSGATITGSIELTFDEPRSFVLSRDASTFTGALDVLLPAQAFGWCAAVTGALGTLDATVSMVADGDVLVADPSYSQSSGSCAGFLGRAPGKGSVTVTAGSLTRTIFVDVIATTELASVEFVLLKAPATPVPSDVDVAFLSTLAPLPSTFKPSSDVVSPSYCYVDVAARLRRPDGRFGLAPPSALVTSSANARPDQGTQGGLTIGPSAAPPLAQITITESSATASIAIDLSACN